MIAGLLFVAAKRGGLGATFSRAPRGTRTSSIGAELGGESGGGVLSGALSDRTGASRTLVGGFPDGGGKAVDARAGTVPEDVLRTSTAAPSPSEPRVRLVRTRIEARWEDRRAEVEDRETHEVRSYAIGDLLPHGSLLVGISTGAAEIMVADSHLVRLREDGGLEKIQNLTAPPPAKALTPARELEPEYAEEIRIALVDLRSDDPTIVQAAIDALIAAGDPAIELLILHVESPIPVREAEYAFPSGSGLELRPRLVGDIVMMVLERITGQTFGDLSKDRLTDVERREIAGAWKRWWGAE